MPTARFLSSLLLAPMILGGAVHAQSGSGGAPPAPPALQRLEAAKGEDGRVRLILVCRAAPASFRVERPAPGKGSLSVFLLGHRSELPQDVTVSGVDLQVRVSEDDDGVRIEIPALGLDLDGVTQEGARLTVDLRLRARGGLVEAGREATQPAAVVDDSYRVGPGDLLTISVFGQDDLGRTVRVVSNGTINFPLLGDIPVAGLTPSAIATRLAEQLARDYVVNPQVLVGVTEYQSQPVNVIGEVQRPGKYYLKGPTRIIDILAEAGGLSENTGTEVVITRYEGTRGQSSTRQIRVATEALFAANNEAYNIPLEAGDVIHALPARFFYIRGEVAKPGQYPVRGGTTIQKAISLAGGFSQWADEKDVQLIRDVKGEKKQIILNMRRIGKGEMEDMKIEPEDIIVVSRRIL